MPTSRQSRQYTGFACRSGRTALITLLSSMHRVRQALQRGVEGCVLLGKTKAHHRRHGILFIESRHRDRRYLVIGHDALAERFVGLVEPERRKIDREEISALRFQYRKADAFQPLRETVAASRQILAHVVKIVCRLAEA